MRQQTPEFGQVQRQVTARPVAQLRAPQQDTLIDPRAGDFAKGLAMFTDVATGAVQQHQQAAKDAQAATADIGLSNYKQAMSALLESNPGLYENPDELSKKQTELFDAYFGDVTDEDIRSKVTQRTDAWMQANQHTYQFQKEDKQRLELGLKSAALSIEALEAQKKAGADPEQLKAYTKSVFKHFQSSPSFGFSQERTEEVIKTLQDSLAGDRALILAETFMDDPDISTETQLWLKAKHAEAMELTTLEKERIKYDLYTSWEDKIQKGALKRAELDEAVQAGHITAKDAITWERRQTSELQARAEKAQQSTAIAQAFLRKDGLSLAYADPTATRKVVNEMHRAAATGQFPGGLAGFYSNVIETGMGADIASRGWENVKRAMNAPREPGQPLPDTVKQWLETEGTTLYNNGLHGALLKPQDAGDLGFFMYATQTLQKTPEEAALLLNPPPEAKFLDIRKFQNVEFERKVRDGLGLEKEDASPLVGAALDLAVRIRKTGEGEEASLETAINTFNKSYVKTEFGVLPRAQILSYGPDKVVERVNFYGKQVAERHSLKPELVKTTFLPDGRLMFHTPDGINRLEAVTMDELAASGLTNPDGTTTIAGERANAIREEQLKYDKGRSELDAISNSLR